MASDTFHSNHSIDVSLLVDCDSIEVAEFFSLTVTIMIVVVLNHLCTVSYVNIGFKKNNS